MALLVLLVGWGCIINLAHPASRSGKAWILTEEKLGAFLSADIAEVQDPAGKKT